MHSTLLEERLGYRFRDVTILELALTHPSLTRQVEGVALNNQRLEFLGDAVLGACIGDMLYRHFPAEPEGALSRRYSALVSGRTLTEIAQELGLHQAMRLSLSEEESGGRAVASNLEDACEALLGALYLDGGFDAAYAFVERHFHARLSQTPEAPKDAKTALQEWAQGNGLPLPEYRVVGQAGPAHAPHFTIEVAVRGLEPGRGEAASKKKAEQLAAEQLLARMGT